ncbi:hypothetical protein E2C01_090056 [Portunus trituberculatus]|uniref:Uncharacterized protein n=1 Tax=Portunus trituberculatus TaxID=210409 RepID=A0A5B7JP30_PORTR|nr:hypothetical protein [Portunus trituberculatus]
METQRCASPVSLILHDVMERQMKPINIQPVQMVRSSCDTKRLGPHQFPGLILNPSSLEVSGPI